MSLLGRVAWDVRRDQPSAGFLSRPKFNDPSLGIPRERSPGIRAHFLRRRQMLVTDPLQRRKTAGRTRHRQCPRTAPEPIDRLDLLARHKKQIEKIILTGEDDASQ